MSTKSRSTLTSKNRFMILTLAAIVAAVVGFQAVGQTVVTPVNQHDLVTGEKKVDDGSLIESLGPIKTFNPFSDSQLISSTTYAFQALASVALEDMSTGTIQVAAAASDDTNSTIQNLG